MTPAQLAVMLEKLGMTREQLAVEMKKWGDPRKLSAIVRNLQRYSTGEVKVPGELKVILNLLLLCQAAKQSV